MSMDQEYNYYVGLGLTGTLNDMRAKYYATDGAGVVRQELGDEGGTIEIAGLNNTVIIANVSTTKTAAENSESIQSAIERAIVSKAKVLIPGGVFDHEGFSLPASGGVSILGNGVSITTLRNTHLTNNSITVNGSVGGPYSSGWSISGMTLTTDMPDEAGQTGGGRSGQIGIDILLASKFSISNVEIRAHDVGIKHEASWMSLYTDVSVARCNTGWEFPETEYTPSAPVTITNGSAWRCVISGKLQAVESLVWNGGDFAYSSSGFLIVGDETRSLAFNSINFEGMSGNCVEFGDGSTGPTNVVFNACRFSGGDGEKERSIWMRRGQGLSFRNCNFSLFTKVVRQESASGSLDFEMCSTASVTTFLDSNGAIFGNAAHILSYPNNPISLNPTGLSTFARQIAGYDGLVTKGISGAGKSSAADGDFISTPPNNTIAVVRNTSNGEAYLAVRVNGVWLKTQLSS